MNTVWDPRTAGMGPGQMPGGFGQPQQQFGYSPQQNGQFPAQGQAPEPPDLTEEVSLNDDLEFEALAALPDQALNESARFAFLIFDAEGNLRLRSGKMFYGRIGEKRFPFLAPPETNPLFNRCVDKWDMPKTRMGAIVLCYNTDKEGNFFQGDTTFRYKLYALLFNDIQASWFRSQNKRRSFRTHDLIRTGTKATQFGVEYGYSVEDQCVFSTLPPDKQQEIMEKAMTLHQKYLGPRIGRPRPDVEIDDLLRDMDPTLRRQGGAPAQAQAGNVWSASPHGYAGPQHQQIGGPNYGQPQHQLPGPAHGGGFSQPQGGHGQSPGQFGMPQHMGAQMGHPQQPQPQMQHPQQPPAGDFGQRLATASHTMGQPGPQQGQGGAQQPAEQPTS